MEEEEKSLWQNKKPLDIRFIQFQMPFVVLQSKKSPKNHSEIWIHSHLNGKRAFESIMSF